MIHEEYTLDEHPIDGYKRKSVQIRHNILLINTLKGIQ